MGGKATRSISKIAADKLHGTSTESDFDLEAEEKRIHELEAKHALIVQYVVDNIYPYAPVTVQAKRLAHDSTKDDCHDVGKLKKQTYLWITLDEALLTQKRVSIDLKAMYPIAVAIDHDGNAIVTDQSSGQRKLKAEDMLALASATQPPPPPLPPHLVTATVASLTVAWTEAPGSILDRFEVQYQKMPAANAVLKAWSVLAHDANSRQGALTDLTCHEGFFFRARCRNPAGWSDFSATGGPFFTLAGAPDKPHALHAAVIADTFIHVCWAAVNDRGSPIVAYTLEVREISETNAPFERVYAGRDRVPLHRTAPETVYGFRLQAANIVGSTPWLESRAIRTTAFGRPEVQELPASCSSERWVECWDPRQEKVFYFNKFTSQRTYDEPAEIADARKATGDAPEETPEMVFRKKRYHLHRDLRGSAPVPPSAFEVTVHRATVLPDTIARFATASKKELLGKPRVTYHDEDGIDSGGLTKDWYLAVSKATLQSSCGLWRPLDDGGVYEMDPDADTPTHLKLFRFLGKFVAKAIYDRHVVALPLAPIVFKHLLGETMTLADLEALDPQLAKSLAWIETHTITDVLFDTFSITRANNVLVDLKENGREIDVTEANKLEYVALRRQWRTAYAVRPQLDAFLSGLHTLLPAAALQPFSWQELQLLLSGNPCVDVDQLRATTVYQGGYDASAQVILWLWQVLRSWENATRQRFLQFTTGASTVPLDGLEPPLTITLSDLSDDALPRSHTCFNQLVLPTYSSYATLVTKLRFAIDNTDGFALS
ncbi:hypothetical protein SPRG_06140 [Saprolegnia parasitica CBS 223.65]|uniref:HECT-type E3 ubiquitin transferase n=1 Tax=Saprolegnia parasitica (strain CBS 223.65) TaxID=695850 RepID=A0A067CIS2_SAPPC|nr:hypothetical protein SPRG_06140 [Saprolegnia parasitica CBS 223.65]KDO29085.1 hypothetical protein SPRG_06140 [Saprolegnia parasitica CBS 223.65]|eukprot:XP_012200253.1 hypothetical protein SPRG_06140 [Saprolegnia parasitica CBS 223.65]